MFGAYHNNWFIDQRVNFGFNPLQLETTMPSFAESFSFAYSLHVVGTYFDGWAMLAHVGGTASGELKEACEEQLNVLGQQGPATRLHIRRVNRALDAAGIASQSMPGSPDDYAKWSESVVNAFYEKISADEAASRHGKARRR